jgi:hypothetical protein
LFCGRGCDFVVIGRCPPDAGADAPGDASGGDASENCASGCGPGLTCCGASCANLQNDILNCGACGNTCAGPDPFCDYGQCTQAPCTVPPPTSGGLCCGDAICGPRQLCCNVPGPGPAMLGPSCADEVNGTCPVGCPACL